jgi:hypothetical protein
VSEAACEHDDPVSTDDSPAPTAAPSPTPESAAPKAEPTAGPAVVLPKSLDPHGTPRPSKPAPGLAGLTGLTGLTGRGVCVLIAVVTFAGGLADMAVSGHRGHLFGVLFAVSSALGAFAVRKKDLRVAMVAPPLLYCALIFVMSLIDQSGLTGGPLTREGFYLGNAFVTGAPAIWVGSLLAGAIGWYRLRETGRR